jgi:signal transduction histidine kinase
MIAQKYLQWYFPLFNYIASERIEARDIDLREIHKCISAVLATSILMWAYAILGVTVFTSQVPGTVGIICAAIHLASPILYKVTNRSLLVTNVVLSTGMIHQGTFSYFSGGFDSPTLKWFGILPLMAGFICGVTGALIWVALTVLASTLFLVLYANGYHFPHDISTTGHIISTSLIQFGFIFFCAVCIIHFHMLNLNQERILSTQAKKISDLFQVLFHDLSNPLVRIGMGLKVAQRGEENLEKGHDIIGKAYQTMTEITQNIRRMYTQQNLDRVDVTPLSLDLAIRHVESLFVEEFKTKNITFDFNREAVSDVMVLVEPISFKNQVLANIVGNAIKFCHNGGRIFVNAIPSEDGLVSVEIQDDGIGIPPELIGQLFAEKKFQSRQGTNGEPGSGVGMKIIKSFVELYGGKISVESQNGTTIKLLLRTK